MIKPQIVIDDPRGIHNRNPASADRMVRSNSYRDLSTIMIVVTRGMIPARAVQSWLNLAGPINQRFIRLFIEGMEVGEGYNTAIEQILAHPDLSRWKYCLTLEEDTCPPPDGLLNLYRDIGKFDAVSGAYWTKGHNGAIQAWGNPSSSPKNYAPFMPAPNAVTEVNGIGMGFALFRLDLFKKLSKPYFRTIQERVPGGGIQMSTQDLAFCSKASLEVGARFAISTNVLVGHWDQDNGIMW